MVLTRRVVLTAAAAAVTGPQWRTSAGHAAAAPQQQQRVSQLGSAAGEYYAPHRTQLYATQASNSRPADPRRACYSRV